MGTTATPHRQASSKEQSFANVFDQHKRNLGYVGIGILVAVAGTWFYLRSNTLKEERASQAYQMAMQSAMSGNIPLAQSDLKKMSLRYKGTTSGTNGAMALAKILYDEGKYQEGIDALKAASTNDDTKYDVHGLIAAGYEGLAKPAEAAKEFEEAAKVARFDPDRDLAKASAARNYTNAGNRDAAIKIWQAIADDQKSPIQIEAKLRLGELQAQVVKI